MSVPPTPAQRQIERAVFLAFFYDILLIIPYFVVALMVESITMVGEVMRGVLLISVAVASWVTLRRIHRRRTGAYDFGLGKIEQFQSLAIAGLLIAAAGFMIVQAVTKTPDDGEVGWINALAVGFVFMNFLANAAPLLPLWRAARIGYSVIVNAQLRAKTAKTLGSSVLVTTVAVDQLSGLPELSLWADRVGVAIVVVITLHAAVHLLRAALPDLLDRTLGESDQSRINRVLAANIDGYDSLEWCRSRRAGSGVEIDLGLGFTGTRSFGEVGRIALAIESELAEAIAGARVTVTPRLLAVEADRPAAGEIRSAGGSSGSV